jgi:hypothetical protein
MNFQCYALCLLAGSILAVNGPNANSSRELATINILALNGKTGKPLAKLRFLVIGGLSEVGVKRHEQFAEFTTRSDGTAVLTIDEAKIKWIDVAPDFYVVCLPKSHSGFFSVDAILDQGAVVANSCNNKIIREPMRGQLVIYARPETFFERMQR